MTKRKKLLTSEAERVIIIIIIIIISKAERVLLTYDTFRRWSHLGSNFMRGLFGLSELVSLRSVSRTMRLCN